ncbi:helix-turn-helix domain-containing protein [Saccharothrix variisporea]|uniref:helix-turn-helix domain-containing protein n=1 Tax=Saccharothrix variisporea TaxID=543527 RepID=UPI0014769069|nr:helix-turn-helix transcriptional regulator [Saccharothrix variisporea]
MSNPVVQQRRLRTELRKARDRAGRTQREVADALDWSTSKVIRIETGAVNISTTDLRALLQFYGESPEFIDDLVQTARAGRQRVWWDRYKNNLDPAMITLLEFESSTSLIRQYQSLVIPGLLQTEDYAREILRMYSSEDQLEYKVKLRMDRQRILRGEDAVRAFFIMDEAALRRWVGGPAVMRKQLELIKEWGRQPNVTIQVLTFDRGIHRGMRGNFEVFEFATEDQDHVVYLEWPGGSTVVQNNPKQVSQYVEWFITLEQLAPPPETLDVVIDRLMEEMPAS